MPHLPPCPQRPAAPDSDFTAEPFDADFGAVSLNSPALSDAMNAAHVQAAEDPDAVIQSAAAWAVALLLAAGGNGGYASAKRSCRTWQFAGGDVGSSAEWETYMTTPDGAKGYGCAADLSASTKACVLDWREKRVAMLADAK